MNTVALDHFRATRGSGDEPGRGGLISVAHVTTIAFSLRHLLLDQLASIQNDGYRVVGISAAGPEVPVVESRGIRCIPVEMTRNFTPFADVVSLARLVKVMREERFTIVHTHTPKAGLLGQLAARMAGVPIVVNTLHGFYFHDGMRRFWRNFYIRAERIAARCSDVILSQNSEDVRTAVDEGICPTHKIKLLGNGIDLTRFDPSRISPIAIGRARHEFGLRADRPVIGFVGRLVTEKGVLELLQAARLVLQQVPDSQFLIVGPADRDKPDAVTPAIAHEYQIAEACTFTGLREDMPILYALMDLFVLPSHREGFPRAAMEASAMGVPAVVTDIRGCREVVEQGRNGLLVPVKDASALAGAIVDLLTNRSKARRMGRIGCLVAATRFDEQAVFARVRNEYARLLAEINLPVPAQSHGSTSATRELARVQTTQPVGSR